MVLGAEGVRNETTGSLRQIVLVLMDAWLPSHEGKGWGRVICHIAFHFTPTFMVSLSNH